MADRETATRRLERADVPFSDLSEEDLDRLVSLSVFNILDEQFRQSKSFRDILRMHAREIHCQDGDIIVREGDWGNSAFFIISGALVGEPFGKIVANELGQRRPAKKSFFKSLAQWWTNHPTPEHRDASNLRADGEQKIGARGSAENTRIYLQDVPAVLSRYPYPQHFTMEAGQFFGEVAALGRTQRTATVFAKGEAVVLELRWQGLRDLTRRDEGFHKLILQQFREKSLRAMFEASALFQHLKEDRQAMTELVQEAEVATYGQFDRAATFRALAEEGVAQDLAGEALIAQEGDYPNGVIIIRNGLARVSQRHHHGHRTVSYLGPGQMFGFEEIADQWQSSQAAPLRHSLRAIGFLTAVIVPTPLVEMHVLEHPRSSWQGVTSRHPQAGAQGARAAFRRTLPADMKDVGQDFIEFLVQKRFVNGTATMLIDLDRCTRCDDCVRACASTHDNNPRFLRSGPVHGHFMIANACMHCQDPVCMIECPTGAISRHREVREVTINESTCIGCGACARNCPYDAIRMVEIRDAHGNFIRDVADRKPIQKATKCDLCVDQLGGPACQRACPHDALVRIDMRDVDPLAGVCNR